MIWLDVKTTNPNNGQTGNTKLAAILRGKQRKAQREVAFAKVRAALGGPVIVLPVDVTITRVAPSNGLDPHDGLGAALKGVIDGVADALGLKNDRDPRVTWKLDQRRGAPKQYGVEIRIEVRT